jgi:hypothetical protein
VGELSNRGDSLGEYAKAVATLTQAEKPQATKEGSHPADLAFLAMAQHQLGDKEKAKETLSRLREVMKQELLAGYTDTVREAEQTLQQKPASETAKDTKPTKEED